MHQNSTQNAPLCVILFGRYDGNTMRFVCLFLWSFTCHFIAVSFAFYGVFLNIY